MSTNTSGQKRYQRCDGPAIRALRQSRGWTQAEFARIAGYSVRLIQKAEASGSLAPSTLEVLAQSLSIAQAPVRVDELTSSGQSIVREFIQLINEHHASAGRAARHLLSDNVEFWCAGDPDVMPFAGSWRGLEAVDEFFETFFSLLTPAREEFLTGMQYLGNGTEVVAWGEALASAADVPAVPMRIWHHYQIRDGKIARYENHYDTLQGSDYLAKARAQKMLAKRPTFDHSQA